MNILVTGASKGIGRAIAQELKQYGHVYATSRNEDALKSLGCTEYFLCDLANAKDLVKLGDFITEKEIDVLINNAGEYVYSRVEDNKLDDLEHILAVNLKAPIYLSSRAVPHMKNKKWGRIVNIGSISGVMGEACAGMYSSTKAGLIGFSKAAGLELAEYGITVNTINPGWVDTELGCSSIDDSEFSKEEIIDCIPQRRFVTPEEVAGLVKYLISEEAKGITGQSINLCAGLSVGI
ncbi:MAG: SDR family oxidoreductase [Muribaculaceae bacterium]|nr:SDR family oxidoreductase [Muribaculaceae bacterium]